MIARIAAPGERAADARGGAGAGDITRVDRCDHRELRTAGLERIESRAAELLIQRPEEIDFTLDAKYGIPDSHTL
jgi:hypothetical protein